MNNSKTLRIAIIGAGPLGLAAGHALLKKGITDFTIFEQADKAGGTWHSHSYPGLACDVSSHAYTFSYAPNPEWSSNYVLQPEIEAYLQRCAKDFGLEPYIRFNTKISSAHYNNEGEWLLNFNAHEQETFNIVINAMGNQHTAIYPDIEGRDSFQGESWHSTFWNHDASLKGKRVAIVGSAAAAVQIVPKVATDAAKLYVLQRTPNWVLPRGKKDYSPLTIGLMKRFPALARLTGVFHNKLMSLMHKGSLIGNKWQQRFEEMGKKHIQDTVKDPAIREMLKPHSRFGCKRPLVSDDFYQTFNKSHVRLIPSAAQRIETDGLVTASGEKLDVDVIIYCTGYKVQDFDRIEVTGENGVKLSDIMADSPKAYKGIAVPEFPNYFFGAGPNGIVLSVSYFGSAEVNVDCIASLIESMQQSGKTAIKARPSLFESYNQWLQSRFEQFSWGHSSCVSYYKNGEGSSSFLFPGDFKTFKKQQNSCGIDEFECLN